MNETQEHLDWSAFCYVAGEMDAVEAAKFEALLADDQRAREAVARAVADTACIRYALATPQLTTAATHRTAWRRRAIRVASVALGSCLTLLLAFCLVRSSSPIGGGIARQAADSPPSISAAQLAYAWAETRHGLAESQPEATPAPVDSLDPVLLAAVESDSEQSLVAPSWMLAALAEMDRGIDMTEEVQE